MLPNAGTIAWAMSDAVDREWSLVKGRYDWPRLHTCSGVATRVLELISEQVTAKEPI